MTNPVAVLRPASWSMGDVVGTTGTSGQLRLYFNGSVSPIDSNGFSPIVVSDNDDTSAYFLQTTGVTAYVGWNLQSVSLPPLAQIVRVRQRARVFATGTGENIALFTSLGGNSTSGDTFTVTSTSPVEIDGSWQTTAPDGGAWTVSKINQLRWRTFHDVHASAGNQAYIAEAFLDVEYNQAPTAVFSEPIYDQIITDNARPQFQWTYADPESDAQASWRCLVFAAPQTDPTAAAASALADSTLTSNANTSWTPGVLLPDGQLYAYIQVTDAAGTTSAWNAVRFTVNVNAPVIAITTPSSGSTITATDKPTFRWNFSDPGGSAQDRWEGLIFTTQINDPDASSGAAVVSSGVTFSPANSWTLPNSLPNGNYWLYVKAGNNSAGGRYSAWAGVPFSMAVAPPTVSFTAPAANSTITDTNRPTFSWKFASPLGYAQERWQILVFLSGQTDPTAASAQAVLNSGEQFSTATSWVPPTGLSNGAYYAYVRVADVGTNQYSSWVSVSFTVAALPPAIPVVTVDPTPTDFPATAAVPSVAVNVLTAENAFDSDTAGLESSIGTWVAALNAVIARSSANSAFAKRGSYWLQMTASAVGQARAITGSVATTAGRYVSVGAWVQPAATARNVWLRIDWYQGSLLLSSSSGPQYTEQLGSWVQIEATGIAPTGADHAKLNWVVEGCNASEVHYLDCAYIRVTPTQTAYPNLDDPNFVWPTNLFGTPTFQNQMLPTDSSSVWRIVNTVSSDADPLFWHSGDTNIPSVSAPVPTRILDLAGLPTAIKGAYSTCRVLSRKYTGNLFTVYRVSDGTTFNVGFTSALDADLASMVSWAGHSKVYLQTLFDQSGNGLDLTQTTNSHQYLLYDGTQLMTQGGLRRLAATAEDAARGMASAAFTSDTTSKLSAVVVGTMPSGGGGSLPGKVENIVDDFSSSNTALWNGYGNPGVSRVSNQLNLTPMTTYQSVLSVANYDLTGSYFSMQIIQTPSTHIGVEAGMALSVNSNNQFAMFFTGSGLVCRERDAGTNSDTTITWNATSMAYWRLREASGTIFWETSPDNSTWTTRRSKTSGLTGAITSMQASIYAGYWSSAPSPNPNFIVDNVNALSGGEAPRMLSVYGSTNTDASDLKGAILIGRSGQSAATAITRNTATRASQTLAFGTLSMFDAVIDETVDTYSTGTDGTSATGATFNGGAFAYTHISSGFDGTSYASVAGMAVSEIYVFDDVLTTATLSLMQSNISTYFGTAPIPTSGGTGGGGSTGSSAYDTRFKLVAQDDMSVDPRSEWIFYDNGSATSYVAQSWMARNVTYNAAGKYLDFKAWKNGTHREGGAGFWNLPASKGLSKAWEVDFSTDNSPDYGFVFLTWYDGSGVWPVDGEIDVLEQPPGGSFLSTGQSNLHLDTVANSGRHLHAPATSSSLTGELTADITAGNYRADLTRLHTWRVEWISGVSIAIYLDGQLRAKTTDTSYVPHTLPHRLTLQQEFSGVSDANVPSTFVAHTRVYGVRAYAFTG